MSFPEDSRRGDDLASPLVLLATPDAPYLARQYVREILVVLGRLDVEQEALLIVSELVTNVVVHTACPDLVVGVAATTNSLCISVDDCNIAALPMRQPSELGSTDRGLLLVESLSSRWASEPTTHGKRVWADLALSA